MASLQTNKCDSYDIYIHINKIYELVFCIYNNDYQSGVICTAMRDNDFFQLAAGYAAPISVQ